MKTTRLLVAAALLVASASLSFAGPGAQYWQQRRTSAVSAKEQTIVATSESHPAVEAANATPNSSCQGCASCKAKS